MHDSCLEGLCRSEYALKGEQNYRVVSQGQMLLMVHLKDVVLGCEWMCIVL